MTGPAYERPSARGVPDTHGSHPRGAPDTRVAPGTRGDGNHAARGDGSRTAREPGREPGPPIAPRVLYVRFHLPRGPFGASGPVPGTPVDPGASGASGASDQGSRGPGRGPGGGTAPGAESYEHLLGLLTGLTPVVQALPPDAALADIGGSLRYFGQDPAGLAALLRVRVLAHAGADCAIGLAANPLLARLAGRQAAPGTVRAVPPGPDGTAGFLDPLPPDALPGVGPATARTLATYGLVTLGRIAATPLGTLQRIVGAAAARRLYEQARGIDPGAVTPNAPARALAAEHHFGRDELDPARHRGALLLLSGQLGARLRAEGQAAGALTLTVYYADRSTTVRTRTAAEPTGHSPALTGLAYRMYAALGLQRARVRALALRAEGLVPAELAPRQLTLDPGDDRARRIEAVADRVCARFGPGAIRPATLSDVA